MKPIINGDFNFYGMVVGMSDDEHKQNLCNLTALQGICINYLFGFLSNFL